MSRRREDYRGGDAPVTGAKDTVPPGTYAESGANTPDQFKITLPVKCDTSEWIVTECSNPPEDELAIYNEQGWRVPFPSIEGEQLETAHIDEVAEMTEDDWKQLSEISLDNPMYHGVEVHQDKTKWAKLPDVPDDGTIDLGDFSIHVSAFKDFEINRAKYVVLNNPTQEVLRIEVDTGKVILGPGATLDEASKLFWEWVESNWPGIRGA